MIFAKPPEGFNWRVSDHAQGQLDEIFKKHPLMRPYWEVLKERLKHTAHREGTRSQLLAESNAFVFITDFDELPSIGIVYTILGDTITLHSVRIRP